MRVAIFSDVHGNLMALEAVLADIAATGGVDACWFVGDAAALGYDPAGSVRRLAGIDGLVRVRGNTDRYMLQDDLRADPAFAPQFARDAEEAAARLGPIFRNFGWTRERVEGAGGRDWVAALPVEARQQLPDGTRVLLVHAAPGTDDGPGIREDQSDDEVEEAVAGADADVVIVGHTHLPLERNVAGVRVWNLGSVSNPQTDDTRAMWTLLEADARGHQVSRRYATYDVDAMLEALARVDHPAEAYIRRFWVKG